MDLTVYFQPYNSQRPRKAGSMGTIIDQYSGEDFPNWQVAHMCIIGVQEDRKAGENQGCALAPDVFRKYFYDLQVPDEPVSIADLGNIAPGASYDDTMYALRDVCAELIKNEVIPIIIGGSQDLTYAVYQGFEKAEQTVNLVTIDQRLDFGGRDEGFDSKNYLNQIILHQPNYLFNYSNLGHQRFLVEKELLELVGKMYFDVHRLGMLNESILRAEPIIRNADLISVDMGVVRHSDAPGVAHSGPNGLYGEQLCQLGRFAGMSDKVTALGLFEYNPEYDRREMTAHLLAQMAWCFAEGVGHRKNDFPKGPKDEYLKYIVAVPEARDNITFYKSPKSDRWWMDVPYPAGMKNKYERHHLVPCTYEDYQRATNEEIPDLWWKTYQKLT